MADEPHRVLIFDVNETLLDLSGLRTRFEEVFGSGEVVGEWFARLLHGSVVANHIGPYRSFGAIGIEALNSMAKRRGISVAADRASELVSTMRRLPPYPEVPAALERLRGAGFRLAALSNGGLDAILDQLNHSGLAAYVGQVISVESVGRFKPAPEPYRYALSVLDVPAHETLMVAAHDWDIVGARAVGIPGAFVGRLGTVWSLPQPPPDLVVSDCATLADLLIG